MVDDGNSRPTDSTMGATSGGFNVDKPPDPRHREFLNVFGRKVWIFPRLPDLVAKIDAVGFQISGARRPFYCKETGIIRQER